MESFSNLTKLLEDGCLSSQTVEQITRSHVKQVLQEVHRKTPHSILSVSTQLEKLLDATQYLVKHNRSCFSHLKDVGFLYIIGAVLEILVRSAAEEKKSEDWKSLVELSVETILALSDMSSQAKSSVVLQLLPSVFQVLGIKRLSFLSRLEILKTINTILEQCHVQTKEEFLNDAENQEKIKSLICLIQTIGDYEFQVGTVECLMRLFPRKLRKLYADKFMTDKYIHHGFLNIKDKDFETDCRHFLNVVNAKSEDPNQGVYSIPCLTVYIGNKELRKPSDINYSEFWVDFNIGSQRVTIFCEQDSLISQTSNMDDDMWETVAIYKSDVQKCFCSVEEDRVITLEIDLKSPVCDIYPSQHQNVRDNKIRIEFDVDLEMHVTHAIAQTFSVSERVSKVSTVEKPLHISIKEVELSDSQSQVSVAQTVSPTNEPIRDSWSQESSTRKHKVSVPSVPMCSPLVKPNNVKSARENGGNKPSVSKVLPVQSRSESDVVKADEKLVKTTAKKNKNAKNDFVVPKTPLCKNTRSKGKMKTPVVMVNHCGRRDRDKSKEKKKKHGKDQFSDGAAHIKPSADPVEGEVVIPDSLPENKGTEAKQEQVLKVSTSIKIAEDSGIGEDISITTNQETSFCNKASSKLQKDSGSKEDEENGEAAHESDNKEDNTETDQLNGESGSEISDIIPETFDNLDASDTIISSCKMQEKKKENLNQIQHGMRESFGFDALDGEMDSIPDSFEKDNHKRETKSKTEKEKKYKKKGHTKKTKKESHRKKNDRLGSGPEATLTIHELSENDECTDLTKPADKNIARQTAKLVSLSNDYESLKELYDFDIAEKMEATADHSSLVSTINRNENSKQHKDKNIKKEKANGKDIRQRHQVTRKQSKKDKDAKNSVMTQEEENLDEEEACDANTEKSLKEKSVTLSRKSLMWTGRQPDYKELDNLTVKSENTEDLNLSEINKSERGEVSRKKRSGKPTGRINDSVGDGKKYSGNISTKDCKESKDNVSKSTYSNAQSLDHGSSQNSIDVDMEVNSNWPSEETKLTITNEDQHNLSKTIGRTKKKAKTNQDTHEQMSVIIPGKDKNGDFSNSSSKTPCEKKKHSMIVSDKSDKTECDDCQDRSLSDSLYIEEDDSYNARRYRQDVTRPRQQAKNETKSTSNHKVKIDKNLGDTNLNDFNCSLSKDETEDSEDNVKHIKSKSSKTKRKHIKEAYSDKSVSKANEKELGNKSILKHGIKEKGGVNTNERVCVSNKGKVGLKHGSVHQSNKSQLETKCEAMVFQMSYSKSRTSYKSYDWVTETNVKKGPGYDPYDFDAHWDNASLQSDRMKQMSASKEKKSKENVSSKKNKKSEKTEKKNSYSFSNDMRDQPSLNTSAELQIEDDPVKNSLLVQDKDSKKWYRKNKLPKQQTIDKKVESETSNKTQKKPHEFTIESPSPLPDNNSTDEEQDLGTEEQMDLGERLPVQSFSNILKGLVKGTKADKKSMEHKSFLQTPKSLQAMIDEVCDMDDSVCEGTKTPCITVSATRTPKGYKPLNVCVIKTPQSVAISEKQDTDSDDGDRKQAKKAAKKPQRKKKAVNYMEASDIDDEDNQSFEKSRTNTRGSLTHGTSLNTTGINDRSWIAERQKVAKEKDHTKTYKHHKSHRPPPDSEEEKSDDERSSVNMEICSLPVPSMKSSGIISVPVTPACRKWGRGDESLDNLILSPITPYKFIAADDDIQVIQTQEKYSMSLNMDDAENQDFEDYNKLMQQKFNTLLGDSGFASGPSSEVRPSRSTLKRKFPEAELDESEVSSVDSGSQNENETSTFVPKNLFKANTEDLFKKAKKSKASSVYSDLTEETDLELPCDTGVSSFLAAFGADIQKQFKAKRQRMESLTKDTLRATQGQFRQAWANQLQQQSTIHDDYMSKIMLELGEMAKDVDRLKEAEQKTEDFYKYQLMVFRANEQSQRTRMENMRKTHTDYKGSVNSMRKHGHNVQKTVVDQLRKGMTGLQNKLLRDVQKQELMNVKRGLQNMF